MSEITSSSLRALISALRAETEKDSISPENVGYILQQIVDYVDALDVPGLSASVQLAIAAAQSVLGIAQSAESTAKASDTLANEAIQVANNASSRVDEALQTVLEAVEEVEAMRAKTAANLPILPFSGVLAGQLVYEQQSSLFNPGDNGAYLVYCSYYRTFLLCVPRETEEDEPVIFGDGTFYMNWPTASLYGNPSGNGVTPFDDRIYFSSLQSCFYHWYAGALKKVGLTLGENPYEAYPGNLGAANAAAIAELQQQGGGSGSGGTEVLLVPDGKPDDQEWEEEAGPAQEYGIADYVWLSERKRLVLKVYGETTKWYKRWQGDAVAGSPDEEGFIRLKPFKLVQMGASLYTWNDLWESLVKINNLELGTAPTQAYPGDQGAAIAEAIGSIQETIDEALADTVSDFAISDEDGFAIVKFEDGHIKTKNFNSQEFEGLQKITVKLGREEICDGFAMSENDYAQVPSSIYGCTSPIDCVGVEKIKITTMKVTDGSAYGILFCDKTSNVGFIQCEAADELGVSVQEIDVPEGAEYFFATFFNCQTQQSVGEFSCELTYPADRIGRTGKRPGFDWAYYFAPWVNRAVNQYWLSANDSPQPPEDLVATTSAVVLPEDYDKDGKPSPVILYCMDTEDYVSFMEWPDSPPKKLNSFQRDGFAVIVCNGIENTFAASSNNFANAPQNVSAFIKSFEYVRQNFNVEDKFCLIGAGMGALVATQICRMHPNLVKGYVMLSPQVKYEGVTDLLVGRYLGLGYDQPTADDLQNSDKLIGYVPENFVPHITQMPPTLMIYGALETDAVSNYLWFCNALRAKQLLIAARCVEGLDASDIKNYNSGSGNVHTGAVNFFKSL